MHTLMISDVSIRQDADGRYCLNDLHRAAGGESRHKPANFFQNQQTTELVTELSDDGITASLAPVNIIKGGLTADNRQGTYACKELVYAYAMWISPSFHLKVIRAYDALVTGAQPTLSPSTLSQNYLLTNRLARSFSATLKSFGFKDANAIAISANQGAAKVTGINLLQHLGHTHLLAEKQEVALTPTELGRMHGLSAVMVNKLLWRDGYQDKVGDHWIPTEKGKPFARVFDTGKRNNSGVPVQQVKWIASVSNHIRTQKVN